MCVLLGVDGDGHPIRAHKQGVLVRHCFVGARLLVDDATGANVCVELGVHLEPLADNERGLRVCGDVGQPFQVPVEVSAVKQSLLGIGCGVYPRSVGFGEAVLFTRDGVAAVIKFAVVRGPQGLVAHSVFHIIVVPGGAPCAKEVDFVAGASVLVAC